MQAAFSCNPILVSYCHLSHSPSHVLAAIKSLLLLLLNTNLMHGKYVGRACSKRLETGWDCVLLLIQIARARIHIKHVAMATAEEPSDAILIPPAHFSILLLEELYAALNIHFILATVQL